MTPALLGAVLLLLGLAGVARADGPAWVAACAGSGVGAGMMGWCLA